MEQTFHILGWVSSDAYVSGTKQLELSSKQTIMQHSSTLALQC